MTDFRGRATRPEFWWFYLINLIVLISCYLLVIGSIIAAGLGGIMAMIGLCIYAMVAGLAQLSLVVRRLHDTGKSGWWYFIGMIPLIGAILLIVFLAQPGEPYANNWGPPPGDDFDDSDFADSLIQD